MTPREALRYRRAVTATPKVFGIGLPKTGTTSLFTAFDLLGYRSATFRHLRALDPTSWFDGDFGPDQLAGYDTVTDAPISAYYPQLDIRYPGSKFVLTLRDVEPWLDSCRRHFDKIEAGAGPSEFGNLSHLAVFGVRRYSADRFRYVHRMHDITARAYFADRPGDLLILDLAAGNGWEELCAFLDRPVPDEPFPHVQPGHVLDD